MKKQQKERILKMIEVYKVAIESNIDADISMRSRDVCGSSCVSIYDDHLSTDVHRNSKDFDEKIKEMQNYISGVKNKTTITDGIEYCNTCDYCLSDCKCTEQEKDLINPSI